ncbi:MAG: endonuclease/exonuclease/phosphatase family protein, partial [Proteobacteria bacterium]|nr:endonuclease/exonuclease/phosphatase family protein [Pseudomonadota bacterium]
AQYESILRDFESVRCLQDYERHPKRPQHHPMLEQILGKVEMFEATPALSHKSASDFIRITSWNIERGMALPGILNAIQTHPELAKTDVFLLTEVDSGMGRSGNKNVTEELCKALNMYGVYIPCYFNLDQGNGAEASLNKGRNTRGIQGNAILSRYPIGDVKAVELPNTKDHLRGNERQIGNEYAIVANIRHPAKKFDAICAHLAAHSSRTQRKKQMQKVADVMNVRQGPAIVGGDFNTSTYNSNKAWRAILSFWRRVFMGNAITHHYPYPENYFEKKLFKTLENVGFTLEGFNVKGGCTLHYDFNDPFFRLSLGDWLPQWCFHFIDWALKPHNGKCSFKLDWLLGREVTPTHIAIIQDLPKNPNRLSDHDPILVDIHP